MTILAGLFLDDLIEFIIEEASENWGQLEIEKAKQNAIEIMSNMPANDGQESAFTIYVQPAFNKINSDPYKCNPEIVYWEIPGDILEFMGGIVSEGVAIVTEKLIEVIGILDTIDAATDLL